MAADFVIFAPPKGTAVKVERADVLQVTTAPSYIVYSGRSSWLDVKKYRFYPTESVTISSTIGTPKWHTGKITAISDTEVALNEPGGAVKLAKDKIATLDIISYTPLSDRNEYWAEECGFPPFCLLNASLWPRLLHIGLKMRVRLFDSALPEDDTPIECE